MISDWRDRNPDALQALNDCAPLRRAAGPDEVAQAAAWLLSDRSAYATGVILPLDGGISH